VCTEMIGNGQTEENVPRASLVVSTCRGGAEHNAKSKCDGKTS
jgi:hypothetical protein